MNSSLNSPEKKFELFRPEIEATQAAWVQAVLESNTESLAALMTEDFFGVTLSGIRLSREDFLTVFRSGAFRISKYVFTECHYHFYANTTVTSATLDLALVVNGLPFDGQVLMTGVWIRGDNGWKCACYHLSDIRKQVAWEGLKKK